MISSRVSGAVSMTNAPAGAAARISAGTREPAYRQTGQRSISRSPRTVIRSGAPGPAPMKCTVTVPLARGLVPRGGREIAARRVEPRRIGVEAAGGAVADEDEGQHVDLCARQLRQSEDMSFF